MKVFLLLTLMLFVLPSFLNAGDKSVSEELADVVSEVERLNSMRSELAATFERRDIQADEQTFKTVCKPVGAEMKRVAKENGWKMVQMADRYRNPAHKLDKEAEAVFERMNDDKKMMGEWVRTHMDGTEGIRYFRRIEVESSCLACHGEKHERPEFVKEGYPDDRAYGFETGDLRGIYSVFVPAQIKAE